MIAHKVGGLAAVASLSLVLVSGGLYASWSDAGQVTAGANVGTFACEVSSETVGAVISPDRKSVTYAEPAIQSSVVGDVATLSVDVTAIGSIPARVHWLYSTSVVPGGHWAVSEGTPSITDDVTLAAGASKHYDDLGFVVTLLDNDDIGRVQSVTYTANCAEVPPPPTNVVVPDVVGLAEADAISAITGAGLTLGTMTEAFSSASLSGHIVSTSPVAGASVPPGTAVDCVKSKGVELVVVPDVVGETYANAVSDVTGAGLTAGSRTDVYSDTVPDGRVISTSPSAGVMVAPGTAVNYVVSKGEEPPPPPPISFVGVASAPSSGYSAANTIALPAGWQPGDTAIVFATNGPTSTAPVVPAGWTALSGAAPSATYTGSGTNNTTISAVSRVGYRVLQAGDTDTGIWTNARRIAVVVYRNVGSVGPAASTGAGEGGSVSAKYVTFPALSASSGSWLVGLGYLETTVQPGYWNTKTITAPAGTVNRTAGAAAATSTKLAVIDSNGTTTGWASQTVSTGFTGGIPYTSAAMNGITLELKRTP